MERYGKTANVFKRDHETHKLIEGEYSTDELAWLAKLEWEFTEKIDGTNVRIIWNDPDNPYVQVRGRSDNAALHPEVVEYLLSKHLVDRFHEVFTDIGIAPVCIYGEAYGAGIQKGGLYSPVKSFAAFDVKVGDIWLDRSNTYNVVSKLGLKHVPIVMRGPLIKGIEHVRRGLQSHFGEFYAEGLVARTPMGLLDRRGRRIVCKIKHKDVYNGEMP